MTYIDERRWAYYEADGNPMRGGEVKLPENLDLSAFYAAGGGASAGINKTLPFWQAFQSFRAGERNAEQVSAAFLDDMPFVPLCYRAGMAAYSKGLAPDFSLAAYAMYGNIPNLKRTEVS